ncbi:hypothetical protein P8452_30831 [Trifolium repens]|nr:hypothetical protein P8452_30831 [Trifolium repens]
MEDEATEGDARREIFYERKTRVHLKVIWMKSNLRKSKNPKVLLHRVAIFTQRPPDAPDFEGHVDVPPEPEPPKLA